jgi:hypothetical protein
VEVLEKLAPFIDKAQQFRQTRNMKQQHWVHVEEKKGSEYTSRGDLFLACLHNGNSSIKQSSRLN